MRAITILVTLLAISLPSCGQLDTTDRTQPVAGSRAQLDCDQARWADLEAQMRVTDGDYDGAVQAHQQAEQKMQEARRRQTMGQSGH
jgi:hypothetical protein